MKINTKILKILSLVLALSILAPTIASASPVVTKEETVYVNLNNSGEERDKLSSIWIHSYSDMSKVVDKSLLEDVVNIKGDTKPTKEGEKLIWDTEGSDIYYQGTPNEELPIQTEIKYYLDGKEVNPRDIIGESGNLKISIDIQNIDKQSVKLNNGNKKVIYTPYMVATVVNLPTENFSNISTNTGKLISDGNRQIISHISLPGLKESLDIEKNLDSIQDHLEITTDVVDFEMESIMFAATSEIADMDILDSAKDLSELIDGLDELEEASNELTEATEKLLRGQEDLHVGIDDLVNGSNDLNIGADELLSGSNKLQEGLGTVHQGSKDIEEGTDTLSNSANELGQGFMELGNGTLEFSNKASDFSQGASQLADGISTIPESVNALGEGMEELIYNTSVIKNGQEDLAKGLGKSTSALKEIKAGKEKESSIVDLLLKGTNGLDKIANGLGELPGGKPLANKMKEILSEQRMGLEGMKNSSDELISALNQVEQGLEEAEVAASQLTQGIEGVNTGQKEINGGLDELSNGTLELKNASAKLAEGSSGLQKGAEDIRDNAKIAKSGANQFVDGSKDLATATGDLSNGIGELNNGAGELNQGISQFSKGTRELLNGGEKLQDGSYQLLNGTKELNKGIQQFNDEGIGKISDEINSSDLNINDIIETKDKLIELSKDNNSFSGISQDMDGKLKFIMKTESIKNEKTEEVVEESLDEAEESKGLINWIKGIFN